MKFKIVLNFLNKALTFYYPGAANYWHTVTPLNKNFNLNSFDYYYLDFSSKSDYPEPLDPKGIPVYDEPDEGHVYHPIVIAQYAIGLYEKYLKNKESNFRDAFLKQAAWMLDNGIDNGRGVVWNMNFHLKCYDLKSPWISSMAQGECISVLCRAYTLTGEKKYLDTAIKAMKPFTITVADGGVLAYFEDNIVYEEYPSINKTNAVLNGFVFALYGLYDLYRVSRNETALKLFNDGINSLKKLLIKFDTGGWSRYSLYDYPAEYVASSTYHWIVIHQLMSLYLITGEEIFRKYSKEWESYTYSFVNKTKVLIKKLTYAHTL